MVAFVGRGQARKLVGMRHPVERAGVHDASAHACAVTVHVLRGGVRHDIRAPLDGVTVHGRRERVIHNQRHAVRMRRIRETLDIKHGQRRVGDGLAEHGLRVRAERRLKLLVGAVGADERALQAHALHGMRQQVVRAAVNGA